MVNLKWITQKEFETYLRVKEFVEKNGYSESELKGKVRGKLPAEIALVVRSVDVEPKRYECIKDVAIDIRVSKETLIYAYESRRPLITRRKGAVKVFHIEWL